MCCKNKWMGIYFWHDCLWSSVDLLSTETGKNSEKKLFEASGDTPKVKQQINIYSRKIHENVGRKASIWHLNQEHFLHHFSHLSEAMTPVQNAVAKNTVLPLSPSLNQTMSVFERWGLSSFTSLPLLEWWLSLG